MDDVQHRFTVDVDAPPESVFPLVADLKHYEQLLHLVHRVEPESDDGSEDGSDDEQEARPAWTVTLRAKIGPFARSKRLRMERTVNEPFSTARFERTEHDARDHSPWTLEATVSPTEAGSHVIMTLDYGGGLWSGALGGVLEAQVATARQNLRALAGRSQSDS